MNIKLPVMSNITKYRKCIILPAFCRYPILDKKWPNNANSPIKMNTFGGQNYSSED